MKLAVAVVHEQDASRAVEVLGGRGFGVTRLNSEGGFLQRRNSLLLMGIDDNLVEEVISTLRSVCKPRHEQLGGGHGEQRATEADVEVEVGRATVFVLDLGRVERL
ncbi:MAG: cyclic-di-AMP receptor [Candidatus Dormiibacterota bacterium]